MNAVFDHRRGDSPLLISVPHDGRELPAAMQSRMSPSGLALPDTDWDVAKLYAFAEVLDASIVTARYSRYVIDLNRAADDAVLYPGQVVTGLCPLATFAGDDIYLPGEGVDESEREGRINTYWRPYHDHIRTTLDAIKSRYGFALLWDAHSIPSVVPRLFDGQLPALNLGSNDGESCASNLEAPVAAIAEASEHSFISNGRFKGGFITRHYGDPANDIHALQLEIAQRAYLDEETLCWDERKASRLRDTLRKMLDAFIGDCG